jgi:hypothetical protein
MKLPEVKLIVVVAAAMIMNSLANAQTDPQKNQAAKSSLPDSVFFNSLVAHYTRSIDEADTILGSQIWAPSSEVSFIHPGGSLYGWNGVKSIYKMFKDNFISRKLSFFDVKFAYYGNVSWLTFYWVFDATLKADNSTVQTKGRETQIWKKINSEWRLVHVHYSDMPAVGQGIQ